MDANTLYVVVQFACWFAAAWLSARPPRRWPPYVSMTVAVFVFWIMPGGVRTLLARHDASLGGLGLGFQALFGWAIAIPYCLAIRAVARRLQKRCQFAGDDRAEETQ